MSLERIFTSNCVVRHRMDDIPAKWRPLVDVSADDAIDLVLSTLSSDDTSPLAVRCREAGEIGLIPPPRPRDRKHARLWKLAIAYSETDAIWFNYPSDEFLTHRLLLPPDYLRIVAQLGALHFGTMSGVLLWPRAIEGSASSLSLQTTTPLVPFYSHQSGDFDCWLADDHDCIVFFNHETCAAKQICSAGLAAWTEMRFSEYCASR